MFGHIMLTIPCSLTVVMIALLLLIIGTGLLKPIFQPQLVNYMTTMIDV